MRDFWGKLTAAGIAMLWVSLFAMDSFALGGDGPEKPTYQIRVEAGHPWRPPFGLDRVGRSTAVVEIATDGQLAREFLLIGYCQGNETIRFTLSLTGKSPYVCRIPLDVWPTELALSAKSSDGVIVELARQSVRGSPFEADAMALPDQVVNPVDLGTILPPSNWLLLSKGQAGTVDVAAICRSGDMPGARANVWFESAPTEKTTAGIALVQDRRVQIRLPLPPASAATERDVLHVAIVSTDGTERWHKTIQTMVVHHPAKRPDFGASETKLRYDAPISVRAADGTFSSMDYASAWDPKLQDVVVALPNGQRFVFWRGSCYIPFWASRQNVGFNYEWAENTPPADGVDCVEPLMDKELRYGRVRIVESTAARIHVRWTYQSCDFNYRVWGDSAVEDYYFYPDGFGTRVLTLQSDPKADYELSEFIVLTPQATYPLSIFPSNMMDILFVDGQKREITCPFLPNEQGEKVKPHDVPAIYRVRMHKDEPLAAIYFNPRDTNLPGTFYPPFFDNGELVTPLYWGSHWPLARGKTTGWAIDDRVGYTPCHNSVVSWCKRRPTPLHSSQLETLDTLGRRKPMLVQTWVWLIGMSDASDERLLAWASSFSSPPSLEIEGARLDAEPYVAERRAIRLIVENKNVTITIKPGDWCVNPVFELADAPRVLRCVQLDDRVLAPKQYAWDGKTLWLDATLTRPATLRLGLTDNK